MLNAVIHGKAGRIDIERDAESLSWRQLYKKREDLLTSAFFSRFSYLSGLLQHRLLKKWLGGGDFTVFKRADFWPSYDLPDNDVREFVEPDLLLRFEDFDVLVEVKPPQGGDQYLTQWLNEIEGYFAQDDTKPLYFLAIGRVGNVLESLDIKALRTISSQFVDIKSIEWKPIAQELYQLQRSQKLDAQDSRVVDDMLQALELYGVRGYEVKWGDLCAPYANRSLDLNAISQWRLAHIKIKDGVLHGSED